MKGLEGGGEEMAAQEGGGDGLAQLRRRLEEGLAELEASSSDQVREGGAKRSRAAFALSHLSSALASRQNARECESQRVERASQGVLEELEGLLREAREEVKEGKRKLEKMQASNWDAVEKARLQNEQHQQVRMHLGALSFGDGLGASGSACPCRLDSEEEGM